MKDPTHTQCTLKKGDIQTTAWLPSKFAIEGKCVKLLDEDGWVVLSTGTCMPSDYVPTNRNSYRNTFASIEKE